MPVASQASGGTQAEGAPCHRELGETQEGMLAGLGCAGLGILPAGHRAVPAREAAEGTQDPQGLLNQETGRCCGLKGFFTTFNN